MWDVFISHAFEDKETVARPLAKLLTEAGLRVWYDEFTLTLGDSLRRSIENGLAQSRYGIVIISPNFLSKEWPQKELDGLFAREIASGKIILPVWHEISRKDVLAHSPLLADKLAVSTSKGLTVVLEEILRVTSIDRPNYRYREGHTVTGSSFTRSQDASPTALSSGVAVSLSKSVPVQPPEFPQRKIDPDVGKMPKTKMSFLLALDFLLAAAGVGCFIEWRTLRDPELIVLAILAIFVAMCIAGVIVSRAS